MDKAARAARFFATRFFVIIALLGAQSFPQQPQQMSSLDRGRALDMLKTISNEVRKHYYDPKFHGVDFDAKVAEAKQKIEKATSFNMAMSHIAALLDTLNDSHTFFLPPQHAYRHDYELRYQIIGNRCFVTRVRPGSDAETKGIKPGDEVLAVNGFDVNRDDLWKLRYVFSVLRPKAALHLSLAGPPGAQRQVDVAARVVQEQRVRSIGELWSEIVYGAESTAIRYREYGDQLMILKIPEFFGLTASEADGLISKARKYSNLIVDLRGNPGGSIDILRYLLGGMFDKEIKIADRAGRKETKPEIAKPLHDHFKGKLVVLVDAESASASELFARVVQLEKRGVVMGDQTAGAVMEAEDHIEQNGGDTVALYGASITEWDLIMTDGKSLEHTGVTPDELLLPSPNALANGRDPVLARAAETLGVKLSPEDAGKAFPYEWSPE